MNIKSLLLGSAAALMSGYAVAYMSEMLDTVFVKGEDGKPLRINAIDYNEDVHGEIIDPKKETGVAMTASTMLSSPTGPAAEPIAPSSIQHSTPERTAPDANGQTTPVISDDAGNASPDGQRTVALNPPEPPVAPTGAGSQAQRMVAKNGSKYFVVDAAGNAVTGEGINDKGYKTDAEAWAAAYPTAPAPAPTA